MERGTDIIEKKDSIKVRFRERSSENCGCHQVGFIGRITGLSRSLTGQESGKKENDETF